MSKILQIQGFGVAKLPVSTPFPSLSGNIVPKPAGRLLSDSKIKGGELPAYWQHNFDKFSKKLAYLKKQTLRAK